ncbi:hypothetical protein CBL_08519 [Carabus blaptoides fortunei]
MSRRKSRVWTFFDEVNEEPNKVKCNQCEAVISRGGTGKTANTTSMVNHIKHKHCELVSQLSVAIKNVNEESASSTSVSKIPKNIIPHLYSETKSEIRKNILIADAISVTTDIWTNTNNLESFLSFTAHWLDESYTFRHAVLQMKHFPEQHTAQNIKECLDNIPSLWDISRIKIHAVVRDNGRNMVKAIDDSSFSAPFEEVTKIISSSCSSISEVSPHLKILLKYLESYVDVDNNEDIIHMKTELENGLKKRIDLEKNKVFTLANLLDPRYKAQFFETKNMHGVISQFFLEALKNSLDEDSESEEGTESGSNSPNNNLQQHYEAERETIENEIENTDRNEFPATTSASVTIRNADTQEEVIHEETPENANPSTPKQSRTTNIFRATHSRKRKMVDDNISIISAAIDKLDKVVQSYNNEAEDEFNIFAKHVAVQLKQLPLYDAIICQEQIQTVIRQKRFEVLSRQSQ